MKRRELYMYYHKLTPDEIVGATELDCELDIRGITGGGDYAIPNYCTNLAVKRCTECPLRNYIFDCHNNIVARDDDTFAQFDA